VVMAISSHIDCLVDTDYTDTSSPYQLVFE
jgi:hypothetical protein